MNGKDLFEAMGFIDERFVDEAERCGLPVRASFPWLRMAACLCLVMLGLWCVKPFLHGTPGGPTETTAPDFFPEGYLEVVVCVEQMTDDGFTGTITELPTPGPFEIGTVVTVEITERTEHLSETADGDLEHVEKPDYTGCHVRVDFFDYDPDAAVIFANIIRELPPT